MKRFSILILVPMSALILSACGAREAQATPTVDVVALQSTMAAAAFTMIAETQSAIPTVTPPPTATLTNTPAPTNTPLPVSSSGAPATPVANSNPGGGDPCVNKVLPASLQGETVKIRINNSTKAALAVSVYLSQTTSQSVCGYRNYQIAAEQPLVINDLVEGCYTVWAWNPDPEGYFIVTNGATSCIDSSTKWVFEISTSSIKVRPG